MDALKVAALKALGISQEVIDKLLADVAYTEKSAIAANVRYKSASSNPDYDLFETGFDLLTAVKDARGMGAAIDAARQAIDVLVHAATKSLPTAPAGEVPYDVNADAMAQILRGRR